MNNKYTSIIGFTLLFLLFLTYTWLNSPSQKQIEEHKFALKKYQDSLQKANAEANKKEKLQKAAEDSLKLTESKILSDSSLSQSSRDSILKALKETSLKALPSDKNLGVFAAASVCEEKKIVVENDKLIVTFSSKGGRIVDVQLKGFLGYNHKTADKYDKTDVHLMNHPSDKFEYFIPINGADRGGVNTQELCFEPTVNGKTVSFKAYSEDQKGYIEQKYNLDNGYLISYDLNLNGLRNQIPAKEKNIILTWNLNLPKLEKNAEYERRMSSIHFKEVESSPSYCTCASDANEKIEKNIQWISNAQQFFNSSLMFNGNLKPRSADLNTVMSAKEAAHLKELNSSISFPLADQENMEYKMQFFIGPNDHNLLSKLDNGLEQIIPFGWSIFGAISRYVIRPMFNAFIYIVPNYGLVIILLTLLLRVLLFPLQFNMLKSGVKMSILRPKMDEMRKKYKDDPQGLQVEQMKMYSEYGVNPLGGCLPMVLTTPIWIALYRFFPASIEFRQKGFLWADDLVSYDSIFDFGYIPVIGDYYGDHVSLFTLLWCISMFAFLIYNSKQMDLSAGGANAKMMMYMQYSFPVIFFFALNSWAAGLTCYMLFSNLFNILQTFLVKNVIINKKKLEAQMESRKNNPKPKSAFQQRYEDALKQQQEMKKKKK
jgi:YidC/Oxa1 family membrane protein insertase